MIKIWELIHHLVAHPLMVILPKKLGTKFHDYTALRAFPDKFKGKNG